MIHYSARQSQASCPNQRPPEDPNTSTPTGPTLFAGWTTRTCARSFRVLQVKIGKVSWKKSIYRCWREWSSECSILMIGSSPHSSKAECPDSHVHPPYTCSLSPASPLLHSPSSPATSLEQAIYKPSPFSLRFSHRGNSIKRKRRWWRGGGKDIGICLIHGGCGGRGVSLMSSGGIYKDHWAGKMQVRKGMGMARYGHAQCVTIPCQSTLSTGYIRNMLCEVHPVLAGLQSVQQFVFIVKRHYRDA